MPHSANTHTGWIRLLLIGGLFVSSAAAHGQIRYIASTGNDTRPCTSAAAPCRTLQRGINTAPSGGEVQVLDSGAYGIGTITKSLTVSADGAAIFSRVEINNASAIVALRGLNLIGPGITRPGVRVFAAAAVHIERCTVERFDDHGIYVSAPDVEVFVTDTTSRDNRLAGIVIYDANATPEDIGSMSLTVDNSFFVNNGGDGALLHGGTHTFTNTTLSGNRANGINSLFAAISITSTRATGNEAAGFVLFGTQATVESSLAQGNWYGLFVDGYQDQVTISNSVFTKNVDRGIFGDVRTRGNNTIVDNATDVDGTLTPLAGQ